MKTYNATVYRELRWWVIDVPELVVATQVRHLADAEWMVRDCIAVTLDCEPDAFDVEITVTLPDEVSSDLESVIALQAKAAAIQTEAAATRRRAARRLADAGITVRDIGAVLGVSHQRAHQLISGKH